MQVLLGISDPGEDIVKECINNNITVIPIPGACAAINALITSGLDTKEFVFLGFLPLNNKTRKEKLDLISKECKTIIIYEAPHKLVKTLNDLNKYIPNRNIVLARELTKIHEEYIRGTVSQIINSEINLKGEFVIIIEGNNEKVKEENKWDNIDIKEHYKYYENQNMSKNEILKQMANDRELSKNDIYKLLLKN